jgi:hypothetical protein
MRVERELREGARVLATTIIADHEDRLARLRSALMELRYKVLDDNREVADILEREVVEMLDRFAAGAAGPDLRTIGPNEYDGRRDVADGAEQTNSAPTDSTDRVVDQPQADLHEHPAPIVGKLSVNSQIARVLRERGLKRVATDHDSATFRCWNYTVRVWVGARWEVARGKKGEKITTGKGAPALAAALAP